jgi:hypothetical protein
LSEWWTYQASDFLMFSPRIYWRLFESMNRAWWPAQPILLVAALAWLGLQARRPAGPGAVSARAAAAGLALCWAVVAWAFLLQRFEPIQWVAGAYAVAFFLQAGGLCLLALHGGIGVDIGRPRRWAGLALGAWALLGHPLLSWAFGRPWPQAEVFGLAPDPTAIGTLGFLLLIRATGPRSRWLLGGLWLVPITWCLVSAATLLTLGAGQGAVMLAAAAVAVVAVLRRRCEATVPAKP